MKCGFSFAAVLISLSEFNPDANYLGGYHGKKKTNR